MGIQSTIELNREEAEKMAIAKMQQEKTDIYAFVVKTMTNEQIEDFLEEDFYNYFIRQWNQS